MCGLKGEVAVVEKVRGVRGCTMDVMDVVDVVECRGVEGAVGLIDVALGGLSERQFVPRVEVMNVLLDVRGLLTAVPVP